MPPRPSAPLSPQSDGWLARPLVEGGIVSATQIEILLEEGVPSIWAAAVERQWTTSAAICSRISE